MRALEKAKKAKEKIVIDSFPQYDPFVSCNRLFLVRPPAFMQKPPYKVLSKKVIEELMSK